MDKYIGKCLAGRYEIQDIIGVGGMAHVYRAHDKVDDRTVAVKILKEEFLSNEDFTRRFKNESKAIAILSHPNIVKVIDVSFGDALQYIVMEYIDGITLKEYIDQQRVIKWKEAVHFTVQILRALQHAHDKGIVHRDIKPQNIMLLPDGTIKVTDFGIARFARTDIRATAITDQAIGSVHYISPEQARGELTDEKADIYSVGVMMYEMLTGQLPFEADNAVSVAIMQLQSEPRKPREINPDMPEGLEEITLRAMQKDPGKRYQSAAEMLYDIDKFKQDPSIHFAYTYFHDDMPTRFIDRVSRTGARPLDEEEDEREKKGAPILPILLAVTAIVVLISLIFAGILFVNNFLNPSGNTDEVLVPDFVGQKFEDVVNNPEYKGVFTFKYKEVSHATAEVGVIVDQDPAPRRTVKKGQCEIELSVSVGQQMVEVPNVIDKTQVDAEQFLTNSGLKTEAIYEQNPEFTPGHVIRTEPAHPQRVPVGTVVKVYISSGADPIALPNLVDSSLEQAKEALQTQGFLSVPTIIYQNTSDPKYARGGIVMQQFPAADTMMDPSAPITLYVSSGYKDLTDIDVQLPDDDSTVQLQVYISGILRTDEEYSFAPMIGNIIGSKKLSFHEQLASYPVLIKISIDGGTYQNYLSFTVDGVQGMVAEGSWVQYPVGGSETTTTTTEGETQTTGSDTDTTTTTTDTTATTTTAADQTV